MRLGLLRTSVVIMALAALWGCKDSEPDLNMNPDGSDLSGIYVGAKPMMAPSELGDDDTEDSAPIYYDSFPEGSLLYFSQKGSSITQIPNFDDQDESAVPYQYIYQYYQNDKASWEEGFNFNVYKPTERFGFDWVDALNVGPDGNIFKFFAFHFPVDNEIRWSVETDQTGGTGDINDPDGPNYPYNTDNLLKSDILGAYHATSAPFTRMRFRLFHLMTYLKVTIYVPEIQTVTDSKGEEIGYSGFRQADFLGAYLMNALTDFNIDWSSARSSDTEAPLVQVNTNGQRHNVKMYWHKSNQTEPEDLVVKDFYEGSVSGVTDGKDKVWRYDFSVIFPSQTFDGNMLCFAAKTPGGNTKYYYFSTSQWITGEGKLFQPSQGALQQLYLYLPRNANETILIGAKVLPWNGALTDMTVTKQPKEDDEP